MATMRKSSFAADGRSFAGSDKSDWSSVGAALLVEESFCDDIDADVHWSSREEWQLACRVAASKGLSKSEFLAKFLLHVCELSLRGQEHEITEQKIGTQIFNRPPGYNPAEDNIVRSYARLLRKRLEEYFVGEGKDEALILRIPRGGYVPVFDRTENKRGNPEPGKLPARTHEPPVSEVPPFEGKQILASATTKAVPVKPWTYSSWIIGIAGIFVGLLLATGWARWKASHLNTEASAAHPIWATLFQSNRNTLIVPADSGLGILENLSRRSVSIEQYANGTYLPEMASAAGVDRGNFNDLGRQRYTSVVDLDVTTRLARLPEYIPSRTQIRYARGVTTEDIKDSNSILLGSKHTNPWVSLFESTMNFTLEYTSTVDESFIVNHKPRAGEQAVYRNGSSESTLTYGVIAYLPNLNGDGHVLIVEGLNMAATQAAAEMLFNEHAIRPVLQKISSPNGTLKPFELLIETSSVGASSPGARIIAMRVHGEP